MTRRREGVQSAAPVWKPLSSRLRSSAFLRDVLVLCSGAASAQLLVVLVLPILARLYSPDDFGTLAVFLSIVNVLAIVSTLRLEVALPIPDSNAQANHLFRLCILTIFGTMSIAAVALSGYEGDLLVGGHEELSSYYRMAVPLGAGAIGLYQVLSYYAVRLQRYGDIARSKIYQAISVVAVQISLFSMGAFALLLGEVVSRLASAGSLAGSARMGLTRQETESRETFARTYVRYRRFPLIATPAALVNAGGLYAPPLLITMAYGAEVAGYYVLVQRLIGTPSSLVSQATSRVYIGEASRRIRGSSDRLSPLFYSVVKVLFVFAVVPFSAAALLGPFVVGVLFGSEWVEAGQLVPVLVPMLMGQFIVVPISQTLNLLEKQHLQFYWDAGRLLLVVACLGFAPKAIPDQYVVFILFSAAMTASYFMLLAITMVAVQKHETHKHG